MAGSGNFTSADTTVLLTFANIEIDEESFLSILDQCQKEQNRGRGRIQNQNQDQNQDEKDDENQIEMKCDDDNDDQNQNQDRRMSATSVPETTLTFELWLTAVLTNTKQRLMSCVLGSKYGHSVPTYLDRIDNHSSASFAALGLTERRTGYRGDIISGTGQGLGTGTGVGQGQGQGLGQSQGLGRGVLGGKGGLRMQLSFNSLFQQSAQYSTMTTSNLNSMMGSYVDSSEEVVQSRKRGREKQLGENKMSEKTVDYTTSDFLKTFGIDDSNQINQHGEKNIGNQSRKSSITKNENENEKENENNENLNHDKKSRDDDEMNVDTNDDTNYNKSDNNEDKDETKNADKDAIDSENNNEDKNDSRKENRVENTTFQGSLLDNSIASSWQEKDGNDYENDYKNNFKNLNENNHENEKEDENYFRLKEQASNAERNINSTGNYTGNSAGYSAGNFAGFAGNSAGNLAVNSLKDTWGQTRLQASKSSNNLKTVNGNGNGNGNGIKKPTLPLPPVRAQLLKNTAAKKKMLLKNGFNEFMGRSTPRCLKNDLDSTPTLSVFGVINNNQGSFGGNKKMSDLNLPILTDTKSIKDTVEELRRGKNCRYFTIFDFILFDFELFFCLSLMVYDLLCPLLFCVTSLPSSVVNLYFFNF